MGVIMSQEKRRALPAKVWDGVCRVVVNMQAGLTLMERNATERRIYDHVAGNAVELWVDSTHVHWEAFGITAACQADRKSVFTRGKGSSRQATIDAIAELLRRRAVEFAKSDMVLKG